MLIYSAFRLCINLNFEKLTLKTGFVVQGHIYQKGGQKLKIKWKFELKVPQAHRRSRPTQTRRRPRLLGSAHQSPLLGSASPSSPISRAPDWSSLLFPQRCFFSSSRRGRGRLGLLISLLRHGRPSLVLISTFWGFTVLCAILNYCKKLSLCTYMH